MTEKRCKYCLEVKDISEFFDVPKHRDGKSNMCYTCKKIRNSIYYQNHKERLNSVREEWKNEHPEEIKQISKNWIVKHYADDINFRLAHLIRTRTSNAYRYYLKTGNHTVSRKGDIDFEGIFNHIGEIPTGYHYGFPIDEFSLSIDHICPLLSFYLTTPIQYAAAVHPLNHRWLSWQSNYSRQWDDGYDVLTHKEMLLEKV
jgi:hypothetical protein